MKVFTIAEETSECYGMGNYGNELRIVKEGSYGTGHFPPIFKRRTNAVKYLNKLRNDRTKYSTGKQVVALELVE